MWSFKIIQLVEISIQFIASSSRASFMVKLEELLGDEYADFEVLNSVEKTCMAMTHALINFCLSPHLGSGRCCWG